MLHWIRWWLIGLTLLIVGLGAVWGTHYLLSDDGPRSPAGAARRASVVPELAEVSRKVPTPAGLSMVAEGPWGRLEIIPITISPPAEFMPESLPSKAREVLWYFPNTDRSRLAGLLLKAGLPDSLRSELMSRAELDDLKVGGYVIRPGRELVLGLRPEIRAKLYAILHDYGENRAQRNAFLFCGTSTEQWFHDSSISPETVKLVTPMVYRYGSVMFFADAVTVAPLLKSARERRLLLRALARESTLMLKLQMSHDSDIESLVNYWGRGGRAKDVRPILESFAQLDETEGLDITHLLPVFARQRIYTYPPPPARRRSLSYDCHWTALNFFSEQPDDRRFATFAEDYYRIPDDPQLGDLVVLVNHKGVFVHSTVYIAGDILFTKNGADITPWMFLTLDSMKDFYPRSKGLKVVYLRRKGF